MAKSKLISRMAKMGQPMLPFLPGSAPVQLDSSDSEIEVGGPQNLEATASVCVCVWESLLLTRISLVPNSQFFPLPFYCKLPRESRVR